MILTHPAGESATSPSFPSGSWPVDTPGGRFHAEWDDQAPVTREGQLIFFFQFLHVGARWQEFLRTCPLHYTGNRGSSARNVMGTALLSILCGHWRYAHINAVRGDGINPGLLGMSGTVSEDAVRLGIGRIEEKSGLDWLSGQIIESIVPALGLPWILDIDVTVKPLYGRQQGAQIGYNPQKPGRPSHVKGALRANAVTQISNELRQIHAITERWSAQQRWTLLLNRLLRRLIGGKWLPGLPNSS